MYQFKLEKFQGPLDLLLQLIQEDKLDISEISLSKVTDEYLQYIESNSEISPEELADFLVVATKLLLLKSRLLLPDLPADPEDDPSNLTKQLKIYQEYLKAMETIAGLIAKKHFTFARTKPLMALTPTFSPGTTINKDKMRELFQQIIKGLEKLVILPQSVMEKTVSLQEKISQIKDIIKSASQVSFHNIMESARSKTELIISFLALLELVKQQEIHVHQQNNFGDIVIKRFQL